MLLPPFRAENRRTWDDAAAAPGATQGSHCRQRARPGAGIDALDICLVADSLDIGGAERHVVDLATALRRRGHAVTIACSTDGPLTDTAAAGDVSVLPLLHHRVKRCVSSRYAWRLGSLLRAHTFDVVHAHMYASQVAAAVAVLNTGVPLVMTEHSECCWQLKRHRRIAHWARSRAQHIIAVSDAIFTGLLEPLGAQKITLIPNAVPPLTDLQFRRRADVRQGGARPAYVGVVARLCPEKGVDIFLQAVARIAPSVPDTRFVIVGDGPLMRPLQARAESLGVVSRVRFLGARTDARAIMATLDLLVVPSLTEGSPLVVLEALSAGLPILASRVGHIPAQLARHDSAILVPPGNPKALADALRSLLGDSGRFAALRSAAAHGTGQDSHDSMVERVEQIYRAARGRSGGALPATRHPIAPT